MVSWFSVKWRVAVLGKLLSSAASRREFSRHGGLSFEEVLRSPEPVLTGFNTSAMICTSRRTLTLTGRKEGSPLWVAAQGLQQAALKDS